MKEVLFMRSKNNNKIHLNPSLFPFGSSSDLHLQPGSYVCQIHAEQGNLIFHHFAYDIYNGTWTGHTENNEPEDFVIHEGETRNLTFTCGTNSGYSDDVSITNPSLLKPAEFTYTCIPA